MGFVIACQACGGMEEVSGDGLRDRERYERGLCGACLRRADPPVPGVVTWFVDPATFAAFAADGAGHLRDVGEAARGSSLWGPGKVGWGIILHERGADGALGASLWGVVTAVGAPDRGLCEVAIRQVPPGGFRVAGADGAHARAAEQCGQCGAVLAAEWAWDRCPECLRVLERAGDQARAGQQFVAAHGAALREALAAYAHDAWSRGMRNMEREMVPSVDRTWLMLSLYQLVQWRNSAEMAYAELSEVEKDRDRAEADRILAILRGKG